MILCIVGPSCVGKTTTCEYIHSETSVPFMEASDFVKDRYSEAPNSDSIMEFVIKEFRDKGKATFAKPVIEKIRANASQQIIICGFRTREEINSVRSEFENVETIGIYANSLLRFQRKLKRDKPKADYSYKNFLIKDFTEYDFGILNTLRTESADIIVNEGTFEDLYSKVDHVVIDSYLK